MNQIAIMESKIEVLCKQLDDKDKELRAVKLAHAVEKDIMQTNFDQCKSAAEYWKKKYQEVCKCKDCPFCGQRQCIMRSRTSPIMPRSYFKEGL